MRYRSSLASSLDQKTQDALAELKAYLIKKKENTNAAEHRPHIFTSSRWRKERRRAG
jgi:hypothetical protein